MTIPNHSIKSKRCTKHRRLRNKLITALLLVIASISSKAETILSLNNIEQRVDKVYSVNGSDPFIVFKLGASERIKQSKANANYISLDISVAEPINRDNVTFELFFKPIKIDGQIAFDPLYRMQLDVPLSALEAHSDSLMIALPDDIKLQIDQEIRLDFNACKKCAFQISSPPLLINGANTDTPNANKVFAHRILNGAKSIPDAGMELDSEEWHLNQILKLNNLLTIDGQDPYLVSPDLDIDTNTLGGVLFSLDYQLTSDEPRNYQLFYATGQHAFVENASSTVRVNDDNDGISRFVIPLHFLSESHPKARILERLRLDLLPPSANNLGAWSFAEIKLLSKKDMSKHLQQVPTRIIHNKRQRAAGLGLVKKVVKKLLSDPWFLVMYGFLLIMTIVGFWRQFSR